MSNEPTGRVLDELLAELEADIAHARRVLPGLLRAMPRQPDVDGLRSPNSQPGGRGPDTPDPTASAGIAAADRTPWIGEGTDPAIARQFLILAVLRAADIAQRITVTIRQQRPDLARPKLARCIGCYRLIIGPAREDQCEACYPTGRVLDELLAELEADIAHARRVLPGLLRAMPRQPDVDGLRSPNSQPGGRGPDTPDPTASAGIAAADRTPWIGEGTDPAIARQFLILAVLRAADIAQRITVTIRQQRPDLARPKLARCIGCYRLIIGPAREDQCEACYRRAARHGTRTPGQPA